MPPRAHRGVSAVAMLQAATPTASTRFPPATSAALPPTSCVPAYPTKNALSTTPSVVLLHSSSFAMLMAATDMLLLSA